MSLLQNSLFVAVLSGVGFIVAYRLYGRFISRRVLGFQVESETPASRYRDGRDYVPTHPAILFGHHFASIAGLGPIVGPAIAVVWGWLPALLWVLFGSVFIGAVHDLATLYASLRHDGRGIGDLTNDILGARARVLFLIIIFFLLALAMGVFALMMAQLFTALSPQAVIPTIALIAIAVVIGLLVYLRRWPLGRVTLLGLGLMFVALFVGMRQPIALYKVYLSNDVRQEIASASDGAMSSTEGTRAGTPSDARTYFESRQESDPRIAAFATQVTAAERKAKDHWTYAMLVYAFVASVLPVWLLLQPRDYINSYQLYIGLGAIIVGLLVWRPEIVAPPIHADAAVDDPIWPFLFITVACGAISGFHNLVSSGTTARQLRSERNATAVGYGAMLTEGFLAVLVILACCAGLGAGYHTVYAGTLTGTAALGAFLDGAGRVIAQPFLRLGLAEEGAAVLLARSFIAVVVVSFAMTTLDSGTRLLRYNVETIGRLSRIRLLQNRYAASLVAVFAIGAIALLKINGMPAGLALWKLFGTTNQLLAAIGLLVVSVMLYTMRKPIAYTVVPMVGMMMTVTWAMLLKAREFFIAWRSTGDSGYRALFFVGAVLIVLTAWLVIESVIVFVGRWREHHAPAETAPPSAATQPPGQ